MVTPSPSRPWPAPSSSLSLSRFSSVSLEVRHLVEINPLFQSFFFLFLFFKVFDTCCGRLRCENFDL